MSEKITLNNSDCELEKDSTELIEFYDKNAPAFYGHIVKIVHHKEIADRVLVKAFVDASDGNIPIHEYQTPFIAVLNHCRKTSLRTIKAIQMFQACSCNSNMSKQKSVL